MWEVYISIYNMFPSSSQWVLNVFPMGVPNIALGITSSSLQGRYWYHGTRLVKVFACAALSLSLSLFTLIHIWRGKEQMVKFQVVKIWSSSHECSYICSELRTALFCLRQARDCCHLSSKCHTSCYLRLWIKLFCCFLKVFWVQSDSNFIHSEGGGGEGHGIGNSFNSCWWSSSLKNGSFGTESHENWKKNPNTHFGLGRLGELAIIVWEKERNKERKKESLPIHSKLSRRSTEKAHSAAA